jgi:glutamine---fructose-6-phosphate transaminase (isomerizing)
MLVTHPRSGDQHTRMDRESREAPEVLRQQDMLARPIAELAATLRQRPPRVIVTCARGSSAHAATFGKHLIERHIGIPVSPAAPGIASLYRQPLRLEGQVLIAISQAGRSDDIIETTRMARASGALTVGIVNDAASPLAQACEIVLPMEAGPERSIAATKTFVASLAVLVRLVASWSGDLAMQRALDRLPDRLHAASDLDWSAALGALAAADSAMTIGRGPTLAIAREAALKLKEGCQLHAEPFSSAEFQHGPIALVGDGYPIIVFRPTDAAATGLEQLVHRLSREGAAVFSTGTMIDGATPLPALEPDHPDVDPICLIQTFYQLLIQIAARRGGNVDKPRHLQKVTQTR